MEDFHLLSFASLSWRTQKWVGYVNSPLPKAAIYYWCNHIEIGGGFTTGIGGQLRIGTGGWFQSEWLAVFGRNTLTASTNNYSIGMIVNFLIIISGTIAIVWCSTMSLTELQCIFDRGMRMTHLVLTVPGVVWASKVATNEDMLWKKRCAFSIAIFVVMGFALPVTIEWKLVLYATELFLSLSNYK